MCTQLLTLFVAILKIKIFGVQIDLSRLKFNFGSTEHNYKKSLKAIIKNSNFF